MRIDKFISEQGSLSRSDAKAAIKKGQVFVNGEKVRSADLKIDPERDSITLNGKELI